MISNFIWTLIFLFVFKLVKSDHFTSIEKLKKMVLTQEQATIILQSSIEMQTLKIKESLK